MIKSIVRSLHWTPSEFQNLYLDDTDFLGLEYWYDDVIKVEKSITTKQGK